MTQIRNVLQKWHSESTVFILASQKTGIAKHACAKGSLAGNALAKQHLEQKSIRLRSTISVSSREDVRVCIAYSETDDEVENNVKDALETTSR